MRFIADFHIHSHYSMATSKDCCPEQLCQWAGLKGLQVIGTGDFTHPGWIKELKDKLQPAEEGLYRLKPEYARPFAKMPVSAAAAVAAAVSPGPAADDRQKVRFLLSAEISSIYKKNGRVRKIHNLLLVPDIASAEKINAVLERIGNIHSDGRPILGLDSRKLLEIALDCCPQVAFIPAHIWTPHFSLLGSRSGFDSLEECFEDLSGHIFALETGLSSDPAMNWRLSALDRYSLVSNSDAHSPPNLAREANCFETELSYPAIMQALKAKDPQKFLGTIEFYPEEGKYHYDGHRNCQVCWSPEETRLADGICPRCGRKVTIGVMYRATELADRPPGGRPDLAQPYESVVPLLKILAELYQVGESSKKVQQTYFQLLANLGSELEILRTIPLEEIQSQSNALLSEGVRRVRAGEMEISPGYDGEYGKVKLFDDRDRQKFKAQTSLFGLKDLPGKGEAFVHPRHPHPAPPLKGERNESNSPLTGNPINTGNAINLGVPADKASHLTKGVPISQLDPLNQLNEEQRLCVTSGAGPTIIIAGPGTGKTRTLVCRIAHLLQFQKVPPEKILAITFTNKAAQELKSRIRETLPPEIAADGLITGTFHHLCLSILQEELRGTENKDANKDANNKNAANKKAPKALIDEQDALLLIKEVLAEQPSPGGRRIRPQRFHQWISKVKSRAWALDFPSEESFCESPCRSLSGQSSSGQSLSGQTSPPPWFKEALDMADFAHGPASGEAYFCGEHTGEHIDGKHTGGEHTGKEYPDGEHTGGNHPGRERQEYLWSLCLAYQNLLHLYHAYDYDDLLLEVVRLLRSDPAILQKYRDRFSHILVDEFQDVNEIQYLLVKLLSADGAGLLVIGDPDQSIYAFRGADYRFFSRLREDFPGHQLFHLKENYRSQSRILQAASAVIKHNPDRFPLELHPHCPKTREPRGIQLHSVASEQAEGISVVREITRLMGGIDMLQAHGQGQRYGQGQGQGKGKAYRQDGRQQAGQQTGQRTAGQTGNEGTLREGALHFEDGGERELGFSDFAVLFRTSQQAGPLEECFLREGIPYRVVGQKGFLQNPGVQTVLAMLRFLVDPEDDFSLLNLLHRWETGSFPVLLVRQRLHEIARQNQCSLFGAIGFGLDMDDFSSGAREGLQRIIFLWETYHSRIREISTDQLISDLIQSNLIQQETKAKRGEDPDNEDLDNGILNNGAFDKKNPDLERLYQCSKRFASVSEFLQSLLLFRDGDLEYRGNKTSASGDAVSLMTIHAAKGLEFPVIFICGLEEGLLPYDHHDRYSQGHIHLRNEAHVRNEAHEKPQDLKKADPSQTPETPHKPRNIDQQTLQEKLHREEERRLFYVALTRAKDELVLISARHRRRYNKLMQTRPSSFLAEIPPDLIVRSKKTPPAKSRQLRLW